MAFDLPESLSLTPTWIFIGAVIVVVLGEYCKGISFAKYAFQLPPGPPKSWIWGSAMTSNSVTHTIAQWIQQHGPVVSVHQGNQVSVIIGSVEVCANDIVEKEVSALVDHPQAIAAGEMFSQNMRLVLIRVGSANAQLQPKAIEAYRDIQSEDARQLVYDILKAPEKHQEHATRYSNLIILRMTHGRSTPTAYTDAEVVGMKIAAERFGIVMQPGAFLADRIPNLRYVPWYGRQLKAWFHEEYELVLGQTERVQNERASRISIAASGLAGLSFMCTLLEHGHQLSRTEMCYLGGTIFGAANDNVNTACHPEAQACVQEQLDTVVGRERAPSFEDVQRLTKLHAFMHESLRWRPVVPLGFPHRPTRDLIWKWVKLCGRIRSNHKSFPFGFDRRVCPGQYLASDSILITLLCLFWAFLILEPKDAPIDRWAFKDNAVAHPQPFSVMSFSRWDVGHLEEIVGQS
ncbi:cytochrome P450 [Suillus hirtellus]|nr:cytochrome P450 [Suillus hirtellus]